LESKVSEDYTPSTRTRGMGAPEILTRRGGVYWGMIMTIVGLLWFLDVMDVINLGEHFQEAIIPLLLMFAGLYLLVNKVGK
jgi:hypothetical protein